MWVKIKYVLLIVSKKIVNILINIRFIMSCKSY